MKFVQVAVCGALSALNASAYNSSLDDCAEFAALWSGNCGGTDIDAVYTTEDWEEAGAGVSMIFCETTEDDDGNDRYAREPNTGNEVTSYTIFARNCITCREDELTEKVYIRYQSNNMPKHCYGSVGADIVSTYPITNKIDFEVLWNKDVLNT